jgi:glutaredoxin 3
LLFFKIFEIIHRFNNELENNMANVLMYATKQCPYCVRAERLLQRKGVAFEKILLDDKPQLMQEVIAKTGRYTVPQIFIGTTHVGGYDDLAELDSAGELDPLLAI